MEEEYELFTCEVGSFTPCQSCSTVETICEMTEKETKTNQYHASMIKGDDFYHGCYLPASELEKAYSGWNGTLHDISHMGTTHLMGLGATSDIRFFTGYQDNVQYNPDTKIVTCDVYVDEDTQYGKTHIAYINLCEKAGQIPNVSVTFLAKRGVAKAKDIINNYSEFGYKENDNVTYIKDIQPVALSTVLRGVCDDKKGCGIKRNCSTKGSVTPEKSEQEIEAEKVYEEERKKLIEELKRLDKEEKQ